MSNSNKKKGDGFRDLAMPILEEELTTILKPEVKISIEEPKIEHAFDLANENNSIVIECKNYTWTKAGNVPSAKVSTINEAVLYFTFLDTNVKKILCLKKSVHIKKQGSLEDYYVRTYGHLLRDITVYEIEEDENTQKIKKLFPLPKESISHP